MSERLPIGALLRRPCVYRLFDADGALLYVGQTVNPSQRITAHRTGTPWGELIATVEIEDCDDVNRARQREALVILTERPRFNRQHNDAVSPEQQRAADREQLVLIVERAVRAVSSAQYQLDDVRSKLRSAESYWGKEIPERQAAARYAEERLRRFDDGGEY